VPEHKLVPPPRASRKESAESLINHFKVRSKLISLLVFLVLRVMVMSLGTNAVSVFGVDLL
jgi:hypothetical protein